LRDAAAEADIVTCATLSVRPLIEGAWLRPGTHVDLVGSFTPAMREVDDRCITHARVFVDTEAALTESGDLTQPIAAGLLQPEAIAGTLADLCTGRVVGRDNATEITIFKAVGTALSDLAAGVLAYRTLNEES
jgi:ornithine cyclodeaminase